MEEEDDGAWSDIIMYYQNDMDCRIKLKQGKMPDQAERG